MPLGGLQPQAGLGGGYPHFERCDQRPHGGLIFRCDLDLVGRTDSQQIRHYWYRDGIGTDNFFPGVMYIAKDDRLWLGSSDGAIIFTPSSGRSHLVPPHVDIKEVLLFNNKTNWEFLTDSIQRNAAAFNKDDVVMPGRSVRFVVKLAV